MFELISMKTKMEGMKMSEAKDNTAKSKAAKSKETKSKAAETKAVESKETKSSETKTKVIISSEFKKNFDEKMTAVWIDKFLNHLRKGYFSDFLEKNEKWLIATGLCGLYISGILGLLTSFVLPMRYENVAYGPTIGLGVIWLFLCIVIHYIAFKFLPALSNLVKNTPTQLSSKSFLDSLALLAGIAGVLSLLGGLFLWIRTSSFDSFVIGIFVFIFCGYILSLCLVPKNLNIEIIEKTSAGEEFLGLISFFMKGFLKLVPVAFAAGVILTIINIIELLFVKFDSAAQINAQYAEIGTFAKLSLLPLTAYFLFLLYYFVIDLAMAILVVPGKLDAIKEAKK